MEPAFEFTTKECASSQGSSQDYQISNNSLDLSLESFADQNFLCINSSFAETAGMFNFISVFITNI